ncbi:MAG TPA: Ig-like domain-containing protein, partial [Pirellulales bacterium]|nr:Ig-like domain-containing protein [Pirellulales bacterium]
MFELLEKRALLSGNTYSPSPSVADSNVATDNNLRAAIAAANADTGTATDTIQLSSGTYALGEGELEISSTSHSLVIQGKGSVGANATIIDQLSLDRVLQINSGVTVTLEDLEITGGIATSGEATGPGAGGGIWSEGDLTLTDVSVIGNKAISTNNTPADGGGIFSDDGALTIQSSTFGASVFQDNSAIGGIGNSADNFGAGGSAAGGAIFSLTSDPVSISGTSFASNVAIGGASVGTSSGGTADGGAIYVPNGATTPIIINDDSFTYNEAIGGAGGVESGGYAVGGALETQKGGFGTQSTGPAAYVTDSTFAYNTAQGGAGGSDSTNGTGGFGSAGGLEIGNPGSQMVNDTVYGNSAIGGSGANGGSSYGGGVLDATLFFNSVGGMSLLNSTIVNNSAVPGISSLGTPSFSEGGGVENNFLGPDPSLVMANNIVAGNTATWSGPDVNGSVAETDSNFIGDDSGSTGFSVLAGDLLGTSGSPINPQLGPLQNNGGDTLTVAPLTGSPVVTNGDPFADNNQEITVEFDQRGYQRVVSGLVADGAVEIQNSLPSDTDLTTTSGTVTAGQAVTFTATVSPLSVGLTPTGSVTFFDNVGGTLLNIGSAPLVDGVASLQTPTLPLGSGTVTADYSGDNNYLGSTSTGQSEVVSYNVFSGNAYNALPTVSDSNASSAGSLRAAV